MSVPRRSLTATSSCWPPCALGLDLDLEVQRVADQAVLARRQVLDPGVAGVGGVVEDGDRALHQEQRGGVLEAKSVERVLRIHRLVVDGDLRALDPLAEDREHRRLLPGQAHGRLDRVLEQLAGLKALRRRGDPLLQVDLPFPEVGLGDRRRRGGSGRHGRHHPTASELPLGRPHAGLIGPGELLGILHLLAVDLGPERGIQLGLDERARDVERLVEVHGERDRTARDQRQPDVVPVVVGRVLDDRPALKERPLLLAQDQPVAGLPDRRRGDVCDAHPTLARPLEPERHGLLLGVVAGGQDLERLAQLGVESFVEQLDPLDLVQRERPQSLLGHQVQVLDLDHLVLVGGLLLRLDAEDGAGDSGRCGDLDPLAPDLAEQPAEARAGRQVDAEALERLGDRVARVVGHRRDLAAVEVLDDQALEQVVDVVGLEAEVEPGVPLDLAVALEVADATRVEDQCGQRQGRHLTDDRPAFGLGGLDGRDEQCQDGKRADDALHHLRPQGAGMGEGSCRTGSTHAPYHLLRSGPRRFPFYSRRRQVGCRVFRTMRIENRPPHRSPQVWGGTQQRSGIPLLTALSWPTRQAPARASPAMWGLRPLGKAISRHAPPSIVRGRKTQCKPPLRSRSSSSISRGSARSSGGAVPGI